MNCTALIKAACPEITVNETIDGEYTMTLMTCQSKWHFVLMVMVIML